MGTHEVGKNGEGGWWVAGRGRGGGALPGGKAARK